MAKKKVQKVQIHVHDPYRGRPSNEAYIPIGTYDVDDPELHGCADHLVAIGHATRSEFEVYEDEAPVPPVSVTETPSEVTETHLNENAVMGSEDDDAPTASKNPKGNPPTPKDKVTK